MVGTFKTIHLMPKSQVLDTKLQVSTIKIGTPIQFGQFGTGCLGPIWPKFGPKFGPIWSILKLARAGIM